MSNFEEKTVIINARGFKYQVLIENILKQPGTRLYKCLLDKKITESTTSSCDQYGSNEFYFDRDPFVLNMILNFYSTGKLHLTNPECVRFIKNELDYWQINEFVFDSCCEYVYFEKLYEINKIIQTEDEVLLKLSANNSMLRSPSSLRNKIWILFSKAESSIFYFTSLLAVLSIICLGLI